MCKPKSLIFKQLVRYSVNAGGADKIGPRIVVNRRWLFNACIDGLRINFAAFVAPIVSLRSESFTQGLKLSVGAAHSNQ
ncbi:MAG: hypothetical protein ACI8RN_000921 [Glaciecola sp.]